MSVRFKHTRKSRGGKQVGGALLKYKSMSIYDINARFAETNIFGIKQVHDDIDAYIGKTNSKWAAELKERLNLKNSMLTSGTFFNNSVCHHKVSYMNKDGKPETKEFLLGVGRFINCSQFTTDMRTATTIHNRDPLSDGCSWVRSWGEPDVPLFFIVDLQTDEIRFFFMKYLVNKLRNENEFVMSLEDPRIMIHTQTKTEKDQKTQKETTKEIKTVLFYAHRNSTIVEGCGTAKAKPTEFYDKIGSNLVAGLNVQEKVTSAKADKWEKLTKSPANCRPQYPYVSWCTIEEINNIIDSHFITKNYAVDKTYRHVPNRIWKPLCANLLNINAEKNWVIIPQMANIDGVDTPVFDFVESMGQFTDSVVVYRLPVETLKKPPIIKDATGKDVYDPTSCNCIYIQTKEGKLKNPGQAVKDEGYFNVPSNNKITVLGNKLKFWLNALFKLFVSFCPDGMTNMPSCKFTIEKTVDKEKNPVIEYTYPYQIGKAKQNSTTYEKYREIKRIPMSTILNYGVPFIKGISSGGPAIPVLGGKPGELLSVGHFKCMHEFVYPGMVAAITYKQDKTFCDYVDKNVQDNDQALVKMSNEEKEVFLEFIRYLTEEKKSNILRYTYSIIYTNEPCDPRITLSENDGIPGAYRDLQTIHHNQMYSSYLFKIAASNFQLLSISPQFYIDNSPTDCKGPVLQFSSTIASNGINTYYIPYGDNDVVGRIVKIGRDDLHSFLKGEKLLNEVKDKNDHRFYLDLAKTFLNIHMLKPDPTP